VLAPILLLAACGDQTTTPTEPMLDVSAEFSKTARGGRGVQGALGAVYVSSQGLYYDTFVSASALPPHGRFQKLDNGVTEFGPGDPGYLGGRWWIDSNGNNMQDPGDTYLLCPLLPPGRTEM
jgi:hypothetical protein